MSVFGKSDEYLFGEDGMRLHMAHARFIATLLIALRPITSRMVALLDRMAR